MSRERDGIRGFIHVLRQIVSEGFGCRLLFFGFEVLLIFENILPVLIEFLFPTCQLISDFGQLD